jgi:hypothetical protein
MATSSFSGFKMISFISNGVSPSTCAGIKNEVAGKLAFLLAIVAA